MNTDDTEWETHTCAVEWPTLSGAGQQTFATLAEAQKQLPLYGPTAYIVVIEPVQVSIG